MNTTFTLSRTSQGYAPVSKSDFLNQDGISLLDCVLEDSGGLPHSDTLPWLNEGLARIISVTTGASECEDWGREAWGVEFRVNQAKFYSQHDQNYSQTMSLEAFSKVLQEWISFLQSPPDDQKSRIHSFHVPE